MLFQRRTAFIGNNLRHNGIECSRLQTYFEIINSLTTTYPKNTKRILYQLCHKKDDLIFHSFWNSSQNLGWEKHTRWYFWKRIQHSWRTSQCLCRYPTEVQEYSGGYSKHVRSFCINLIAIQKLFFRHGISSLSYLFKFNIHNLFREMVQKTRRGARLNARTQTTVIREQQSKAYYKYMDVKFKTITTQTAYCFLDDLQISTESINFC